MSGDRPTRAGLTALREGLLGVHKALLAIARADYEREHEAVDSPAALLQLLIHHESFAWLHPVSELAARADELAEEDPIPAAEVAAIVRVAVDLLRPDEGGTGFSRKYFDALQGSPDVVMAHAEARRVIDAFGKRAQDLAAARVAGPHICSMTTSSRSSVMLGVWS